MSNGRRKEIIRHLSEDELAEQLRTETDPEMVRRLGFVMNLYRGDTVEAAAAREGKSQPTGNRWADRWNEGGVEGLAPDHGGGRPPKLDDDERERLRERLEAGRPWTAAEISQLIETEFGVTYHPNYIHELLRSLGVRDVTHRST